MKRFEVTVEYDMDPINPRNDDNMGVLIGYHKRYNLGDTEFNKMHKAAADDCSNWAKFERYLRESHDAAVILPVYMYDHSGVCLSVNPYEDKWDSGRLGLIYCTNAMIKNEYSVDDVSPDLLLKVENILKEEVKDYSIYLSGEVYNYVIEEIEVCNLGHEHRRLVDSCGGYDSIDDCTFDGNTALEHYKNEHNGNV